MTLAADVFRWALAHDNPVIRQIALDAIAAERRRRFPQTCHSAVARPY